MSEFTFSKVARPATTRKVIENPFIDVIDGMEVDGDQAISFVMTEPTATDVNRVDRQLTDAGNELNVTVRRTMEGIFEDVPSVKRDGTAKLNKQNEPIIVQVPQGDVTVTFYPVTKIVRKGDGTDEDDE